MSKSFITGTSKEVAEKIGEFVEAGATYIAQLDVSAALFPVADHGRVMERVIEVCAALKGE